MEFKSLIVYQKSKEIYKLLTGKILLNEPDRNIKDQLRRAGYSVVLNKAEGTSRISKADQRLFLLLHVVQLMNVMRT